MEQRPAPLRCCVEHVMMTVESRGVCMEVFRNDVPVARPSREVDFAQ